MHKLNMQLNLQSLFGLLCTAVPVLIGWDPATPSLFLHLDSITRALLVCQDRRHPFFPLFLFVTGTSLWGPKKVGSLRFSAITVLPIYVHALHTGHQLVMHEVALQMESLVLRQVNWFFIERSMYFFLLRRLWTIYFTLGYTVGTFNV